jgi:predicted metalloprotease
MFNSPFGRRFFLALGAILLCGTLGWALGLDPRVLIGGYEILNVPARGNEDRPNEPRFGVPSDPMGIFVSEVLGSTEDEWQAIFTASGQQYRPPTIVLYAGVTVARCGLAEKIMGPFYCVGDQKVYLDLSFFQEIQTEYHGCDVGNSDCQFPEAYVIAHEVGHHVQNLLGILPRVRRLQEHAESESERNRLQVLVELQADCLAGIWGHRVKDKAKIDANDVAAAIRTIEALGNDTLQQNTLGYVVTDSFTHGSAEQRHHWFDMGFTTGSVASCNTFAETSQDH